jgi:hypothetical protein
MNSVGALNFSHRLFIRRSSNMKITKRIAAVGLSVFLMGGLFLSVIESIDSPVRVCSIDPPVRVASIDPPVR